MKCECCEKKKAVTKFRSIQVCEECEEILVKEEKDIRGTNLEDYEEYDEEDCIVPKVEKNPTPTKQEIEEMRLHVINLESRLQVAEREYGYSSGKEKKKLKIFLDNLRNELTERRIEYQYLILKQRFHLENPMTKKKNPAEHVHLEIEESLLPFAILKLLKTSKRSLLKKTIYNALRNSFENIEEHRVYIALDELKKKKLIDDDISGFVHTEKGDLIYKNFCERGGESMMVRQNPVVKKNPRRMKSKEDFEVTVTDYYILHDGREIYITDEKTVHPDYKVAVISQKGESVIEHVLMKDIYRLNAHHTKNFEGVLPAESWKWKGN